MKALLIFPNQLYIQAREGYMHIYIEDECFFNNGISYHKHKLMLHRASMKSHYNQLNGEKIYIEYPTSFELIQGILALYEEITAYDPVHHDVYDNYSKLSVTWLESLNFLTDTNTIKNYFDQKKRYFMYDFYVFQRKRLNILMDDGKPLGGQYSFDSENRKKLPKDITIPIPIDFRKSAEVIAAGKWVEKMFPNHPGSIETFNHPTTRKEALDQLDQFLNHKLVYFGPYQDAMSNIDPYLFHSNLSSSLNIGLLSPLEIIEQVIEKDVPLSSKEGFIRQIIGWREFVRSVYLIEGKDMKHQNFLNHQNKLSNAWYQANIGFPIVDQAIKKYIEFGYLHHIERLMVIGNLMMMLKIDPNEVYRYFMEFSIDGYDWVMVPNIYGMSQFACGDLMTTKPYFSGSNYLKKMGVQNGEWAETWDALFYLFIRDHKEIIETNVRLGVLLTIYNKKSQEDINHYEKLMNQFLDITVKN